MLEGMWEDLGIEREAAWNRHCSKVRTIWSKGSCLLDGEIWEGMILMIGRAGGKMSSHVEVNLVQSALVVSHRGGNEGEGRGCGGRGREIESVEWSDEMLNLSMEREVILGQFVIARSRIEL